MQPIELLQALQIYSIGEFNPGGFLLKRYNGSAAFVHELFLKAIRTDAGDFCWLFDTEASLLRQWVAGRKCYPDRVRLYGNFNAVERSGVQGQPKTARRHIDAFAERIARLDFDPVALLPKIASKSLPAEVRMINDISSGVDRDAEKVRTVVA